MSASRPRLDETWTPAAAKAALQAYFDDADTSEKPKCNSGIALTLGCSLRILQRYLVEREDSPLYPVIEWAFTTVELQDEELMKTPGNRNSGGPMFALKNRGWKDTQTIDQSVRVTDSTADLFKALESSDLFSLTKDLPSSPPVPAASAPSVESKADKSNDSGDLH
jgi:hypothetical protein